MKNSSARAKLSPRHCLNMGKSKTLFNIKSNHLFPIENGKNASNRCSVPFFASMNRSGRNFSGSGK
jgi:hypothetical protein